LKNSELEKTIETNISNVEKTLSKSTRIQFVLNFYQKKVQRFYIMEELVNLWETWKFFFILKNENSENQMNELNNTKQKENKIREFIFCVLEKVK